MTKVEAIKKVMEEQGGTATLQDIYRKAGNYYKGVKLPTTGKPVCAACSTVRLETAEPSRKLVKPLTRLSRLMGRNDHYQVLSPDGIEIAPVTYVSKAAARAAFKEWVQRYKQQGYYLTSRWEKIPFEDIADYCDLITTK